MRAETNYNTTKESSKVFMSLGHLVGIEAQRKTQRGIIARRALRILENYELEQFSQQLPHFDLCRRSIRVNQGERSYYL